MASNNVTSAPLAVWVPAWPLPSTLAPAEQADTQSRFLSLVCPLHTELITEPREGPRTQCQGFPLPHSAMEESQRKGPFWKMQVWAITSYMALSCGDNRAYVPRWLSCKDYTRSPAAVFSQSCCTLAAGGLGRERKISVLEPTSSLLLVPSPRTREHRPISGVLRAPEGE